MRTQRARLDKGQHLRTKLVALGQDPRPDEALPAQAAKLLPALGELSAVDEALASIAEESVRVCAAREKTGREDERKKSQAGRKARPSER